MKEVVLITGANGMVAKSLSKILKDDFKIRFLTRNKTNNNEFKWNLETGFIDVNSFTNVKHIIHLAGAGIANKRWTNNRKEIILSSRVNSAKLILNTLKEHKIKITSFISASAIGYYGTETTKFIFKEKTEKGNDFLSDVCFHWEKEAERFKSENVSKRIIILRMGIVLSNKGGVLKKMMLPIKYFVGAVLGRGNQYIPWIHLNDLSFMIKYLLKNPKLQGVFNAVAPEHVTNKEFTLELAKQMNKPIFLPNIPNLVVRLIFGSSSILLLKGSRVSSDKIIEKGFRFKHSNLNNALQNL